MMPNQYYIKRANYFSFIFLSFLLCVPLGKVFAQQEPLNTMYMFNTVTENAAYAGSRDALNLVLLHRRQWVGLEGAPNTTSFSLHSPIRKSRVALGLSVISDAIGPVNSNFVNTYYAYHLPIADKLTLSFGINFGVYIYNASLLSLTSTSAGDPALNSDPNKVSPNGGAGLFLYSPNYYVGFSIPKLFQSDFYKDRADMSEVRRHLFFTAGYVFNLSDQWALKPSVHTKMVYGSPLSQDIALQIFYANTASFGVNWRLDDAVSFIASYQITPIALLGYSYDVNISELNKFNGGSHEILLSIDLDGIKRSSVSSPRYF